MLMIGGGGGGGGGGRGGGAHGAGLLGVLEAIGSLSFLFSASLLENLTPVFLPS